MKESLLNSVLPFINENFTLEMHLEKCERRLAGLLDTAIEAVNRDIDIYSTVGEAVVDVEMVKREIARRKQESKSND